ncbi:MAG: acyltransferase [Bacteroidetes bacterium]|nr:acyltransferase [Bacteroidota bacterium]
MARRPSVPPTPLAARLLRPAVAALMRRSLRQSFRRVCWVGDRPSIPTDRPVVAYANHHYFHDGYLAWVAARRVLHRTPLLWMRDWDRVPFFRAVGALPFPANDTARRASTVRYTIRYLRARPSTMLAYFPEGALHPPEDGLAPISTTVLERLDRLLPDVLWWPLAMHVTWWGDPRPTVLLGGGTPRAGITGEEPQNLASVLQSIRSASPETSEVLLDSRPSGSERWSMSWLRSLFTPPS